VVVRPNERIPADGVIVAGETAVDESAVTGESVPVDKTAIADSAASVEVGTVAPEHRTFCGDPQRPPAPST
jgi:Cd2+/Zn2+-exporting ATPase